MDKHDKNAQWMCSYLLPSPGGRVVRDLLDKLDDADDEVTRLRGLLEEITSWAIQANEYGAVPNQDLDKLCCTLERIDKPKGNSDE